MKRVLLDTNVILDVLLNREPHVGASAALWAAIETGSGEGVLAAHAVTTIHYLLERVEGAANARRDVSVLLRLFGVAAVDSAVIQNALNLQGADFEDAVTAVAARLSGCDLIATRDPKGFAGSPVRALTPEAIPPLLKQ